MKDLVTILTEARDLIAKPGGWTQGAYAKTAGGKDTDDRDGDGVCFCALGAIRRATGQYHDWNEAHEALRRVIPAHSWLDLWNDAPERTQSDVVAAFDRAIALASSEPKGGR